MGKKDKDRKQPERIQPVPGQLPVNQETLDILVANIIPTSKYFEARFDLLDQRMVGLEEDLGAFRDDINRRFDDMSASTNKRFDEMAAATNQRFEQVEQRFEQVDRRFDEMREETNLRFAQVDRRFDEMREETNLRFAQVDQRFEQVDKRFELVDKRFEQVDGRFEQIDQRLVQICSSIDRLADNLHGRDREQRNFTMRLFSIAIAVSFVGVLGVALKLLGI